MSEKSQILASGHFPQTRIPLMYYLQKEFEMIFLVKQWDLLWRIASIVLQRLFLFHYYNSKIRSFMNLHWPRPFYYAVIYTDPNPEPIWKSWNCPAAPRKIKILLWAIPNYFIGDQDFPIEIDVNKCKNLSNFHQLFVFFSRAFLIHSVLYLSNVVLHQC